MNGDEIIAAVTEIFRPEGEYDDWIPRSQIGNHDFSDEIEAAITEECGEWEYELTADRPFGEEDTQRTVLFFKEHNVYLAFDGYYDSWSGGNWDDANFYEVKPVEKTYTDWEAV